MGPSKTGLLEQQGGAVNKDAVTTTLALATRLAGPRFRKKEILTSFGVRLPRFIILLDWHFTCPRGRGEGLALHGSMHARAQLRLSSRGGGVSLQRRWGVG